MEKFNISCRGAVWVRSCVLRSEKGLTDHKSKLYVANRVGCRRILRPEKSITLLRQKLLLRYFYCFLSSSTIASGHCLQRSRTRHCAVSGMTTTDKQQQFEQIEQSSTLNKRSTCNFMQASIFHANFYTSCNFYISDVLLYLCKISIFHADELNAWIVTLSYSTQAVHNRELVYRLPLGKLHK